MKVQGLLRTAAPLFALLPFCFSTSAQAETRGYVIGWFATATYVDDVKEACPENRNGGEQIKKIIRNLSHLPGWDLEKAKNFALTRGVQDIPRNCGCMINRAFVNGKAYSAYSYPDAAPDVGLETGVGKYAYGFDLGGRNETSKYLDPETGERVDNELWRALGCVNQYQAAPPQMSYSEDLSWNIALDFAPAWLIMITGEDLSKDGKVTVTLDRATQHVKRDAGASILRAVTYVIEPAGRSHNEFKGEIKNGVLSIEPGDLYLEGESPHYSEIELKKAHMRIKMHDDGALSGYWGGYLNWQRYTFVHITRSASGDGVGFYHALRKLADADPDPKTGQNRMISGTWRLEATPAFVATADGKIVATPGSGTSSGTKAVANAK